MRWKRVKGKREAASVGEADNVGAQAHVEAQVPELAAVLCRVGVVGVEQRAWYGSSQKRRTFWEVILRGGVGGGCEAVSKRSSVAVLRRRTVLGRVHFGLVGLGLLDGLEEFCVQALGASFVDGAEDAGAQLGAVRLFGACPCAFGHVCGVGSGSV